MTWSKPSLQHIDGWHVTPAAQASALIMTTPAAFVGLLLTLSIWFIMVGVPMLALSSCSIRFVLSPDQRLAVHPAMFVSLLAVTEIGFGLVAFTSLPNSTGGLFGAMFLTIGAITGLTGWVLWRTSSPLTPPPPSGQRIGLRP